MSRQIQNEDIKSEADLVGAGGSAAQLPNDTKVWVTANGINKTLDQAIIDGDIGSGGATSIMTEWASYTPTFTGFGTPTNINMQWRRDGSDMLIRGYWQNGTLGSTQASFTMPNGELVKTSFRNGSNFRQNFGVWYQWASGGPYYQYNNDGIAGTVDNQPSNNNQLLLAARADSSEFFNDNSGTWTSSNNWIYVNVRVPIEGWNAINVPVSMIPNYAISSENTSQTITSGSLTDVTNLSVSITTHGNPVMMMLIGGSSESQIQIFQATSAVSGSIAFLRDASVLSRQDIETLTQNQTQVALQVPASSFKHFDTPAAGTYTYKVQAQVGGGSSQSIQFVSVKLVVWELGSGSGGFVAPTVQKFLSGSGTYTPSATPLYIKIKMVGAGGGGSGGGANASAGNGANGGDSTFGSSLLSAGGGSGAVSQANTPAAGGSSSLGSGPVGLALSGGSGTCGGQTTTNTVSYAGGCGGNSALGGGGGGSSFSATGGAGSSNTGGGGGGGANAASSGNSGNGGGSGGYVEAIITSPAASYSYSVGSGGSGGTAGTTGNAGGAGGSGVIIVEEYYQ